MLALTSYTFVSALKVIAPVKQVLNYLWLPYRNMASRGIEYNSKHLLKGDPLPPYNGKLRLYNMRFCPFAERAVLALNYKQIDYEIVNIDLIDKPEWITSKSVFGKVPALEIKEGLSIFESLVIVEYLDDAYPDRPLISPDPVQRAFDKIIVQACGATTGLFIKLIRAPETVVDDNVAAFHKELDFIQSQLQLRGTRFLGGSQPSYPDLMIWPLLDRIQMVAKTESRAKIDGDKYKLLLEYLNNMKKDPVISDYRVPDEIFYKFIEAYKTGQKPNYELFNEN